jgi:hypothetical protein
MRAHSFQHLAFEGLRSIHPWLVESRGAVITGTRFFEDLAMPNTRDVDLLAVMGKACISARAGFCPLKPVRR